MCENGLSGWIVKGLLSVLLFTAAAAGQTVVDKSVATVSDGVRTELITYSDLLWQLALTPGASIDQPTSEELNRALQLQINQRLFALEAERLPRPAPTDAEIDEAIGELLKRIPIIEFEQRLRAVGFSSVKDPNFVDIIRKRLSIDKYLTFRFRSFTVITPEELVRYYNETYVPDFRSRFPGVVVPTFAEEQTKITEALTEQKVAANIETFLDEAKRRAQIVILSDV